jgi:type I restriction enzyme M protein
VDGEYADVDPASFDLSVKNPHKQADSALRDPLTILDEMKSLDEESAKILKAIKGML